MDIIANIRIVEDSLASVLLTLALATLASAGLRLRHLPIRFIPWTLFAGLFPFHLWKTLGTLRRVFVDAASWPQLHATLDRVGETFESLAGIAIAAASLYLLMRLRRLQAGAVT